MLSWLPMTAVVASLPEQYRHPGALDGLKARALLFLASIGRNSRATEFLSSFEDSTSPGTNAIAAASLAMTGYPEKARGFLLDSKSPELQKQVLASLSNDSGKHWVAVDGENARGRSGNYTDIARSLDSDIIQLSYSAPDASVKHAAVVALLPRQDNPRVLAALIDHLNTAEDPQLVFELLSAGTIVDTSSNLTAALTRHLASPEKHVRLMTLFRMGNLEDPLIVDRIIPFLGSGDSSERKVAVIALSGVGRFKPEAAEAALRNSLLQRPQDKEFARLVGTYLKELQRPPPSSKSLVEWAKQNPDHQLR